MAAGWRFKGIPFKNECAIFSNFLNLLEKTRQSFEVTSSSLLIFHYYVTSRASSLPMCYIFHFVLHS